jgi:hypothetical protein
MLILTLPLQAKAGAKSDQKVTLFIGDTANLSCIRDKTSIGCRLFDGTSSVGWHIALTPDALTKRIAEAMGEKIVVL